MHAPPQAFGIRGSVAASQNEFALKKKKFKNFKKQSLFVIKCLIIIAHITKAISMITYVFTDQN